MQSKGNYAKVKCATHKFANTGDEFIGTFFIHAIAVLKDHLSHSSDHYTSKGGNS